jgi:hypothetical protein
LRESIKLAASQLSVIALCGAAAIGGILSGHESSEYHTQPLERTAPGRVPSGRQSGPDYSKITGMQQITGGTKAVNRQQQRSFDTFGHATAVTGPDRTARENYDSFFDTSSIRVDEPPKLQESIHIQDRNTFGEVYERHPWIYPFTIYNSTSRPVDLLFVDYALRATQLWLNKTGGAPGPDVNISGHTLADVEPVYDPHTMIMVDKIPVGAKNTPRSRTDGVTQVLPGSLTRSFIESSDSSREPFSHEALATEICQSLVNVTDERTAPGGSARQWLFRTHIGRSFNRPDHVYGIDLASQEAVCNGLGSYVTAAYERSSRLPQATYRQAVFPRTLLTPPAMVLEATLVDYDLYRPERDDFTGLAERITRRDYNEVIASRRADTPTADFYRRHQDL